MKIYRHIIFDLDGTIADPKDGIVQSVKCALRRLGIAGYDPSLLARFIGPPLSHSLRTHFGLDDETIQRAIGLYREEFERCGIEKNEIYAGMEDLLGDLQSRGRRLYVATSKYAAIAKRILDYLGLKGYFTAVEGSNRDSTLTSKTDIIGALILKKHRVSSGEAVMVGDMAYDIIGANNNGIDSIGVTWGYGSRDELESEKPSTIAGSVRELRALLLPDGR
ncbi:MAG: HAD hydrolase-like protein [Spirochaetes bacterium]|nr:HAD hydrolase-like protein [Spirochaetota bacterium]